VYFLLLRTAERAPNVIHIMADDLGFAELGSYGQTLILILIQTPNPETRLITC